jgi:hypothetical protein
MRYSDKSTLVQKIIACSYRLKTSHRIIREEPGEEPEEKRGSLCRLVLDNPRPQTPPLYTGRQNQGCNPKDKRISAHDSPYLSPSLA